MSLLDKKNKINRKISVAPMMDCTDRHDRYFLRLISKNVMLYSEMIASKSAIHGDRKKILSYRIEEKPLALQVGGSDKKELVESHRLPRSDQDSQRFRKAINRCLPRVCVLCSGRY